VTRIAQVGEAASQELAAAVSWYETRRPGLGAELFDAVVTTMDAIALEPELGPLLTGDTAMRRMLVRRFPYQVVYSFTATHVTIAAIAHLERRPE